MNSDRWLNVRYRTYLSWENEIWQPISLQNKKVVKLNMLVHNSNIAADAWMFQEKKLEEFELFKTLYACPVSVVQCLIKPCLCSIQAAGIPQTYTENWQNDICSLDPWWHRELQAHMEQWKLKNASVCLLSPDQEAAFVHLKSCLEQIDTENPIPAVEVMKLHKFIWNTFLVGEKWSTLSSSSS